MTVKVAISAGHSAKVRGAHDVLDEFDENVRVVNRVTEYLRSAGVPVVSFIDLESTTQDENLKRTADWHNQQDRTVDIQIHFNMSDGGTTDNPIGTECWYQTQQNLAEEIASSIAMASGLKDRGAKYSNGLYFLSHTAKPACLAEIAFVNSTKDSSLYTEHFEEICRSLAEAISDEEIESIKPPPVSELPPVEPSRPQDVPLEDRPTLRRGDDGEDVLDLQRMIPRFSGAFDGDFGPVTEENVLRYQRSRGLVPDGIVGPQTWTALYDHQPPVKPTLPPGSLTPAQQARIMQIAEESDIASYNWKDRGIAPDGWTMGMALAFAQTWKKLHANHPAAVKMAKARTDSDKDALNVYRNEFNQLGLANETSGENTLRHLYSLMIGHGVRESSGQHCCGRDQSASNTSSDTAEAGAFQTSYNAHSASDPEFDNLMDEYTAGLSPGYLDAFSIGVSCSSSDWDNYGSGRGEEFQALCKNTPAFSAETAALTLRMLCNHYGPIVRKEVELKSAANDMLLDVQNYMQETESMV
jgi:peptidoglycan hydrolase-like protein with peptidoglycan-binding domain